ncbi:hypothetical protein CSA56_00465 [candidate division KSB3 bacterium]|uniref:Porin domain-containing protein n=1 Tax=candidate division KSB3 bacterium TaxID=2044937 RepID=A0A2G6KMS7_9BACT|nr:MAG: hypothetical protein CSA56_00465 [candidate division KSB3 bacterium]
MQAFLTLFIFTLVMNIAIAAPADEAADLADITEIYNLQEVEEYIELVEQEFDAPLTVDDHKVEVFLELEVSDGSWDEEDIFGDHATQQLLSSADAELHAPFEIAWKWGLSNFTLHSETDETGAFTLPKAQFDSSLGRTVTEQAVYITAAELTGAVANIDIYTEFGITGGSVDQFGETDVTTEELEKAIAMDLAGYYVSGGASVGVGRWTVGLEAGYGQMNMAAEGEQTESNAMEGTALIGSVASDSQAVVSSGTAPAEDDPLQLVYFQGTADRSVTDRLGIKIGALCFAVPEQFVTDFQGKDVSGYGFEFFGDVNYQIAKSIKYSLYMDYALTDKNFEEENIYQILNRFEFNF